MILLGDVGSSCAALDRPFLLTRDDPGPLKLVREPGHARNEGAMILRAVAALLDSIGDGAAIRKKSVRNP